MIKPACLAFLCFCLLFILSCKDELYYGATHPFTEAEERRFPIGYKTGDTITVIYSDSLKTDTFTIRTDGAERFLSTEKRSAMSSPDYYENLRAVFFTSDGKFFMQVQVKNFDEDYLFNQGLFILDFDQRNYSREYKMPLLQVKDTPADQILRVGVHSLDSLYIQYNLQDGISKIQTPDSTFSWTFIK